jgi:hypothetical protein
MDVVSRQRKGLKRNQKPSDYESIFHEQCSWKIDFRSLRSVHIYSHVNTIYGAQTPVLETNGFLVGAESPVFGAAVR